MAKVMITGASSGLGAAIAKRFAARGEELLLIARRKPLLEQLQAELLTSGAAAVEYRVVDLADALQLEQLAAICRIRSNPASGTSAFDERRVGCGLCALREFDSILGH